MDKFSFIDSPELAFPDPAKAKRDRRAQAVVYFTCWLVTVSLAGLWAWEKLEHVTGV